MIELFWLSGLATIIFGGTWLCGKVIDLIPDKTRQRLLRFIDRF